MLNCEINLMLNLTFFSSCTHRSPSFQYFTSGMQTALVQYRYLTLVTEMAFLTPSVHFVPGPKRKFGLCSRYGLPVHATGYRSPWTSSISATTNLKKYIVDKLRRLDYGRTIAKDSDAQNRIDMDIQELEKLNLAREPVTDERLNGTWRIVYTSSKSILGITRPKPFRPNILQQTVDIAGKSIRNKESIKLGPFSVDTAVEAEILDATDKRVTVRFVKFIFFGFIPVSVRDDGSFVGWQDITYLDDDLRVSRGNEGNLFVLEKV